MHRQLRCLPQSIAAADILIAGERESLSTWEPQVLWVGHRPGQARLWMGVRAIVALSGSVSSDEYEDRIASMAQVRRVMPARDPRRCSASERSWKNCKGCPGLLLGRQDQNCLICAQFAGHRDGKASILDFAVSPVTEGSIRRASRLSTWDPQERRQDLNHKCRTLSLLTFTLKLAPSKA